MPSSSPNWIDDCLHRLRSTRIAVFGDFCLDAYWQIDDGPAEQSIETGRPVRRVRHQRYNLGGAGNIIANLIDLGVRHVHPIGLIGDDLFGQQMHSLLAQHDIDTAGLFQCQDDWQTMVYAKPCIGDEELNRIDFGAFNAIADPTIERLAEQLDRAAADCDMVILNQQVPTGVSTPAMIERINAVIRRHDPSHFIVDSRHRTAHYAGTAVKLNAREATDLFRETMSLQLAEEERRLHEIARLLNAGTAQPVFITCGEHGMIVADRGEVHELLGIDVSQPTDPVGAGDTALATLAAVLAGGGDPVTAARLANLAASVTVQKHQTTGTATPDEIRHAADQAGF